VKRGRPLLRQVRHWCNSKRALSHVLEWGNLHRAELAENWQLARQHMPLKQIEPLE
jgi:hypothetical protein